MRVVQIAAEFAPIAKAGGMGEALLGLTRELVGLNESVELFIPKYSWIDNKNLKELNLEMADFRFEEKGQMISNSIWSAVVEECPLGLIEAHHPSGYFHREKIYGYQDDAARFLYFCKTVMEYLKARGEPIDVLHLHDWHTACCAYMAREMRLKVGTILITVHNFEYQGICAPWDLNAIGISPDEKFKEDRYPDAINLLRGGISYADAVVTVSPSYAKESLAPRGAFGLSPLLKKKKFKGILNGICTKSWNPEEDPNLVARYSGKGSSSEITVQKRENKKALQSLIKLDSLDRPLFGVIMRLMPSKGSEFLEAAIESILDQGGAFVLLGYSPIPKIQERFDQIKEEYSETPNVFFGYQYQDALAHRIFAACDFLLMPSLTEPCGLTQLIALRYGAIPIAHSTGGLKDTVFDYEDAMVLPEKRNGIVFHSPTKDSFRDAIKRAVVFWKREAPLFQLTQKRGMQGDYSWKKGGQEYVKLYRKMLGTLS